MMLAGVSVMFNCNDDDTVAPQTNVETPGTDNDQEPDDEDQTDDQNQDDDNNDDGDDETPITEFKMKVDGEEFTYKIFTGEYFSSNKSIDIQAHEVDATYDNQQVVGIQVNFATINTPGEYDIEKVDAFDVVVYFYNRNGEGRPAISGNLTIRKISETRFEATFDKVTIPGVSEDKPVIVLTEGSVSIDLVRRDD
jgi:hypothetical protein